YSVEAGPQDRKVSGAQRNGVPERLRFHRPGHWRTALPQRYRRAANRRVGDRMSVDRRRQELAVDDLLSAGEPPDHSAEPELPADEREPDREGGRRRQWRRRSAALL